MEYSMIRTTKPFFSLCRSVGARKPEWVQGAGGNVSQKLVQNGKKILRIKASGYRLDKVSPSEGYVDLEYAATRDALSQIKDQQDRDLAYAKLLNYAVAFRPQPVHRASMETCFHLMIDTPFVVHFHALTAVLLADGYFSNEPRVMRFLKFTKQRNVVFLDFCKPGLDLAYELAKAPAAQIYILRNHGVILALQHDKQLSIWKKWEDEILRQLRWDFQAYYAASPLKVYFPDTVIYYQELMESMDGQFSDKNIQELWEASQRLFASKPELKEIPSPLWSEISGMPAEQFRKSLGFKLETLA